MSKADNKQLEEAIKRLEHIDRYYDCNNYYSKHDLDCIETALKELERLQEENKIMETEIAEHVYWESIPFAEIKNLYIEKDKIREKIEELKEKKENMYSRIKELENIVGMSLKEYEELNKLYSEYNEVLIRMESLEELLEGK